MDHDEREFRRLLAVNVHRYRETLGLTIEAAAERGDLAPRQWSRIESGEAPRQGATKRSPQAPAERLRTPNPSPRIHEVMSCGPCT